MSWRDQAVCRNSDTNLFFPPPGTRSKQTKQVMDLCRSCPVWFDCLQFAMDMPGRDDFGIWAATTPQIRAELRHNETAA